MQVTVHHINIPQWSTIGYGEGVGPAGEAVTFVGDHRPMRDIGEAIAQAASREDLPVAEIDDWQITGVTTPEKES